MSWIRDLYETYQNNESQVAKDLESTAVLLPIAHSTQNAQIEITIDLAGNFVQAERVLKEEAITIIPVTEESGTRSSGNAPHPLADKLEYIAGDYERFTGKCNDAKYQKYLEGIKQWATSSYTTKQVSAIYVYTEKGTIIEHLVKTGILEVEEGQQQLSQVKINGIPQAECFVRFSIQEDNLEDLQEESKTYKDKTIFNQYIKYYLRQQTNIDLCYGTGEWMPCSNKQPAKIRHAGDKAKLISGNDTSGFTYRGRLQEARQVATIGYEVSQKAHNALRWLIAKQGFSVDELTIVAWEKEGKEIIDPTGGSIDDLLEFEDEISENIMTNEAYAKKLEKATKGYREALDTKSEIIILGVEAATTGRLSVVIYKKLGGQQYIQNIEHWYKSCYWKYWQGNTTKKNQKGLTIATPSLREIAKVAFGDKNEKVLKGTIERLLPCVIDKRKLPKDIIKAALGRIAHPANYESWNTYQNHVGIVCALIRKSRYDYEEEEWEMALDRKNIDRSYVFGRLLAAAHKVEEMAIYYSGEKGRETAAQRFTPQFVKRPAKTMQMIDMKLKPYARRLEAMNKGWYTKELEEIYNLLSIEDFNKQEALSELYLLGYNCQLNSYRVQGDKDKIEELNKEMIREDEK